MVFSDSNVYWYNVTIAPVLAILSASPKNVGIAVLNLKRLRSAASDVTLYGFDALLE